MPATITSAPGADGFPDGVIVKPAVDLDVEFEVALARATRTASSTFAIMSGMNFWPPKPGSTVMISSRSIDLRWSCTAESGVFGFTAKPDLAAVVLDLLDRRCGSVSSHSMWKVMFAAPASTNAVMNFRGREIIRCTSSGSLV